ncbi:MAG: DUF4738 domain-containing protein [Mediterranea sp.]|nr:DUF4738 domain-containing protein [Mediterranea sp.]
MKRFIYLCVCLPLMAAMTACGGNKGNGATRETSVMATMDSADASGVSRLQASRVEISVTFKGKEYHSLVSRVADESLPKVTSEMGDTYLDNTITLRLTTGGKTVVERVFTKKDFAAVVNDDTFLSKSILEGLVYDKTTPEGIVYSASVCYPGTDMYIPLSITITADGRMKMAKGGEE